MGGPEGDAVDEAASAKAAAALKTRTPLPFPMTDPRWPNSDGWVKMQQIIDPGGSEGPINVH
jgi:hypothetical protein